jgi:Fe-S cluster biosynthesis and repair protein YggX
MSFHVGCKTFWNTWHFDQAMLFSRSKLYMLCLIAARQSFSIVLEMMFYIGDFWA